MLFLSDKTFLMFEKYWLHGLALFALNEGMGTFSIIIIKVTLCILIYNNFMNPYVDS